MARGFRTATESVQGRRPQNQDAVLVEVFPGNGLLVALADGMGGHAAGHVASAMALETLLKAIRAGETLEDAVRLSNWQVHRRARDPGNLGMGTTLTALHLTDDRFLLANVGDSRAYRISRRGIRQITEDHSFLAEAMKRGQSEREAMASPWKDALTRSIGAEEEVEVDLFGPFPVEEDTAVLLCSDGLYKTLDRGEIRRIFLTAPAPEEAAEALVAAAYDGGSDDNISVAIVEFGTFPRRRARNGPPLPPGGPGEERRGKGSRPDEEGGEGATSPMASGGPTREEGPMPELSRIPRRKVVEPWELDAGAPQRIVGGPKRKRGSRIPFLLILAGAVSVAAAAAAYFLYLR